MPLTAGSVTITVTGVDPNTGLGNVNIVGGAGPNLAKELASALFTDPKTTAAGATKAQNFYNQLAAILIAHIKTNAQVNSNVIVTSVAGVTSGPSASGPGAGTATGTIT